MTCDLNCSHDLGLSLLRQVCTRQLPNNCCTTLSKHNASQWLVFLRKPSPWKGLNAQLQSSPKQRLRACLLQPEVRPRALAKSPCKHAPSNRQTALSKRAWQLLACAVRAATTAKQPKLKVGNLGLRFSQTCASRVHANFTHGSSLLWPVFLQADTKQLSPARFNSA